jgi:hypothetical protein
MKVDDLLARYKPAEKTIRLLLDGSIQPRIDDARQRLRQARRTEKVDGLSSRVSVIEKEITELETEADVQAAAVTLRAISGEQFSALKLAHPPTDADFKRFREAQQARPYLNLIAPDTNMETFSPALIGLSIVEIDGEEVDWDEKDGKKLWDQLHDGARADLLDAAWEVNGKPSSRPLSESVTDTTSSSVGESTTPADTESPRLSLAEGS